MQTLTELAEVFGTDAGSLLGEAGRPAYPRLQKRFVTGFVVCAGLLLAVSGLELGLFAYWRKLLLHDYSPALYAALWKLFVPPLLWYASGLGAVCFFAMWSPVRCGKQARLALLLAALALGLPVLALMAQYLAVALGNLDGARLACTAASKTCRKTCDSDHSAGANRRLHRAFCLFGKERLKWAFGFSCWQ